MTKEVDPIAAADAAVVYAKAAHTAACRRLEDAEHNRQLACAAVRAEARAKAEAGR